jgi:Raf kinase inhibitor-like YbhB/YbcL family protein
MKTHKITVIFFAVFLLFTSFCGRGRMEKISISSTAFKNGGVIPDEYTCKGSNISPEISWSGVPKNAKSIALICDDPDAPGGNWVHWVVYGIPAGVTSLGRNFIGSSDGTKQGMNDFKRTGYGGPCPPSGTHRYFFRIYALDIVPALPPASATKAALLEAMKGHILTQGEIMGTCRK